MSKLLMNALSLPLLLIVGLFGAGCGSTHATSCTTNAHCTAGNSCIAGVCQSTPPGSGTGGTTDGGPSGIPTALPPGDGAAPDAGCVKLQCQVATCPTGTTTLAGHVYDPSGKVPLYNAMVYVPNQKPDALPAGISCTACGAQVTGSPVSIGLSGSDGSFTLKNVPAGANIPLVFQIGKWRRQVTVPSVTACTANIMTDPNLQRMPRSQTEGDIPHMAVATGAADPLECLLLKIGISRPEFTGPAGSGRIHLYRSNGVALPSGSAAASGLWGSSASLSPYDLVLLPCEGAPNTKGAPILQNIVNYANAGGRVFTTHYGYVWMDDANASPFDQVANWSPDPLGNSFPPSPFNVSVDTTFPKGQAFHDWLTSTGALQAEALPLVESRDDLTSVNTPVGATRWLYGSYNVNANPHDVVQHMTFNTPVHPALAADGSPGLQCGRVVYSDFHIVPSTDASVSFPNECNLSAALTPQEKALIFMLFDVSSCVQSDSTAPSACSAVGQGCSASQACCAGEACNTVKGDPCGTTGTACTCQGFLN